MWSPVIWSLKKENGLLSLWEWDEKIMCLYPERNWHGDGKTMLPLQNDVRFGVSIGMPSMNQVPTGWLLSSPSIFVGDCFRPRLRYHGHPGYPGRDWEVHGPRSEREILGQVDPAPKKPDMLGAGASPNGSVISHALTNYASSFFDGVKHQFPEKRWILSILCWWLHHFPKHRLTDPATQRSHGLQVMKPRLPYHERKEQLQALSQDLQKPQLLWDSSHATLGFTWIYHPPMGIMGISWDL